MVLYMKNLFTLPVRVENDLLSVNEYLSRANQTQRFTFKTGMVGFVCHNNTKVLPDSIIQRM